MKSHNKKIVAPIIVTIITIIYFILYFSFLIYLLSGIWKYILAIFPLAFSILIIIVCIERINEIKKGEEDDISKY